jgi:hypothetical protein
MTLLTLLERPCEQVSAEVATQVPDGLPAPLWDELLEFALDWPTEYWPGLALALAWVEGGYPVERVRNVGRPRADVVSRGTFSTP